MLLTVEPDGPSVYQQSGTHREAIASGSTPPGRAGPPPVSSPWTSAVNFHQREQELRHPPPGRPGRINRSRAR